MRFRNGIIIAMMAFVAFIVTLAAVINSKNSELVSEDYYIKEKSFNDEYDAQQRALNHKNPIKVFKRQALICFENQSDLAIEKIDLAFLRMNDEKADFNIKNQVVPAGILSAKLKKGNYQIQIHYEVRNQSYLQELIWYNK
jgi:hypothetical protein